MNSDIFEGTAPISFELEAGGRAPTTMAPVQKGYAIYALCILVLVNVFILIDRQILTVLAEDIKADLGISDADIGFIYGTAISVFYAVFSIPLGRFADVGVRKNLVAFCVAMWSVMIVLTGTARNLVSFACFRAGVGVGEAGAAPPSMSMIADYFPPRLRSTAMSIFASGVPLGGGLHEKIYNVALSNGRVEDENGKAPPVGNTVDVADASYANSIGDPELAVVWTDPDFDKNELAFYYVRVIEIPTPPLDGLRRQIFRVERHPQRSPHDYAGAGVYVAYLVLAQIAGLCVLGFSVGKDTAGSLILA